MKLNLANLKKISSDENSTTFKHPHGHSIKIAHSGLQESLRNELEKIPLHKNPTSMAKKYAGGGAVKNYAEGTPDEPVSNDKPPVVINVGAQPQVSNAPVAPNPQSSPQAVPQPQAAAPAPQNPDLPPVAPVDPDMPENQSVADQGKDVTPEQGPQGPSAPEAESNTEKPQQQGPQAPQDPQQQFQQHKAVALQDYTVEDKAFQNDLNNGHITPKTYQDLFANKGTLGKVGMLFGMLASGAGSGLSHQPNALMQLMNNEIQNDLAAQQQSKANAQNLIRLNQAHLMNEAQVGFTGAQAGLTNVEANTKAIAFSNMQANRIALDHIAQQVNRLPVGSPDRIKSEQALAMMYNSVNNENFNIASRAASASAYYKMLMGQPGAGGEEAFQQKTAGMRMLGPQGTEMAKNLEEKHFPGLQGQASIPLSGEDRTAINSGIDFDQKLDRFINWTKNHSGDLSPSDINTGKAMAAELQGSYRLNTHGGVYKEGEQNFISKLIDEDPTKFFNDIRVVPQLQAISSENRARLNQLVKSKGFSGYNPPSQQSAPAQQTQTMGGVQYKKVNGGWQRAK